jgi:hypothetical protein
MEVLPETRVKDIEAKVAMRGSADSGAEEGIPSGKSSSVALLYASSVRSSNSQPLSVMQNFMLDTGAPPIYPHITQMISLA